MIQLTDVYNDTSVPLNSQRNTYTPTPPSPHPTPSSSSAPSHNRWLLSEAKKRNPDIKTYGLPWAYPGWVGGPEQTGSPFSHPNLTSTYILKWLEGARDVYNVDVDYIGIWNERASDATYAKTLRKTLDDAGFANTKLVAKDGGADICDDLSKVRAEPATLHDDNDTHLHSVY